MLPARWEGRIDHAPSFCIMSSKAEALHANERQSRLGIVPALQMLWRLDKDDLQGRPHHGFDQVATVRRSIGLADNDMGMQCRLALLIPGNVAYQGQHL